MAGKVRFLVVDSAAFIQNVPLQDIGENIFTILDIVHEIRDKDTRQRLRVLPYELNFREPPPEAVQFITEFSKKTGDYPSLSATDIRLLALTYQLHKENIGLENIKTEPEKNASMKMVPKICENPTSIAGFVFPSKCQNIKENMNIVEDLVETLKDVKIQNDDHSDEEKAIEKLEAKIEELEIHDENCSPDVDNENLCEGSLAINMNENNRPQEDDLDSDEGFDEDEDDLESGWITSDNIKKVKLYMGECDEKATVGVGCITTDFAMQNVLLHVGLHVVSLTGMLIKTTKTFILRCYACFKLTSNMTCQFCPKCGNKTLKRVAVTINEDGSMHYYISTRRPINIRGLKFSLPLPQGGKHSQNPILVADQPTPQNRLPDKVRKRAFNVFDPDFVARSSPFAINDTQSKAIQLGLHLKPNRKNPNEVRKKIGRKRK